MLLQKKEPWKNKTTKDSKKEKKLQKIFQIIIQQMQASEGTLELALRSKPPMQESSRPPKTIINFANDGATTKNYDVF